MDNPSFQPPTSKPDPHWHCKQWVGCAGDCSAPLCTLSPQSPVTVPQLKCQLFHSAPFKMLDLTLYDVIWLPHQRS